MEENKVPVMTIRELRQAFQMLGIKISHETLAFEIEQGIYPFATCFRINGSKKRKFVISRKKFKEWVFDFIGEEAYEAI